MDLDELKARRLRSWGQHSDYRVPDPTAAAEFIRRTGMATLYPASPEAPNLFWAYMGAPDVKGEAKWDSPAGHVYGWRWDLGRAEAAFYGGLVAKKPTWIAWEVLPDVLGFAMERRAPEELYAEGQLSNEAIRIVRAFDGASGILSTKDLRRRAGFPTGKPERAAYLRGVEELDSKLFLAKTFDAEGQGDDMSHALVHIKYAGQVAEALMRSPEEALQKFLRHYLPRSMYFDQKILTKHLRVPTKTMEAAVSLLIEQRLAERLDGWVVTTEGN